VIDYGEAFTSICKGPKLDRQGLHGHRPSSVHNSGWDRRHSFFWLVRRNRPRASFKVRTMCCLIDLKLDQSWSMSYR